MKVKVGSGASVAMAGVVGVVVGVTGVGVGVAAASRPTTIHGCVTRSTGALRIVQRVSGCTSAESHLSFNTRGVRGAHGLRGARGLRGVPGPRGAAAPTPTTSAMFANVDQHGDLGTNVGATSAKEYVGGATYYVVTFDQPITSCAAVAQAGFAGGNLAADSLPSEVHQDASVPDALDVIFRDTDGSTQATAFMLTLTCLS